MACGPSEIGREEESCQGRAEGMNIRPRSLRPVDQALDTGGADAALGLEFS